MVREARRLLALALAGAALALLLCSARAQGQTPPRESAAQAPADAPAQAPAPRPARTPAAGHDFSELMNDIQDQPTAAGDRAWEPEFLKSLPNPPDQPYSMFAPPPPVAPPPRDLERPYFTSDPLMDPPQWPQPGWFSDVQIGVIHPHLFFGQFRHSVVAGGRSVQVAPGSATLGWAIAPRIELGYRLPAGFGAFSVADRFFSAYGSGPFNGPAGATTRTSRLGVNYWDFDYSSRDYTPWTNWSMLWRAGLRTAFTWIGNVADQPFSKAAMGRGVFIAGNSNYTVGNGPHFGLELDRKFPTSGFSFVSKLDIANTFTRERGLFRASTTTLNAAGSPERGVFTQNYWQQVPILNFQVGLGWQPPNNPNIQLYMGYLYEFWWQIASNSNLTVFNGGTRGFFDTQGIVFQAQIKF
jgi:hypothetical protein